MPNPSATRFVLLLACSMISIGAWADAFREVMLAEPTLPTEAEAEEFTMALQGTWVPQYEVNPLYGDHLDFINGEFALMRINLTSMRATWAGMPTMLRGWSIIEVQRVPIDPSVNARLEAIGAESSRLSSFKDGDGKWVRRPRPMVALILLPSTTRDWTTSLVEQALADGVRELWVARIAVETPHSLEFELDTTRAVRGWEELEDSIAYVVVAGDRAWIGGSQASSRDRPTLREQPYRRRVSLGDKVPQSFDDRRSGRMRSEYEKWKGRCQALADPDIDGSVADTCRKWRDQYVALGFEKVVREPRDRNVAGKALSEGEKAFLYPQSQPPAAPHQPYLDYCTLGVRTAGQSRAIHARLAARNYALTAWRLLATTRWGEVPQGWTDEDFREFQGMLLGWERTLWLREDGIVGISGRFDSTNRWRVENGEMKLSFADGAVQLVAPFTDANPPLIDDGRSDTTATYYMELIGSNYEYYERRDLGQDHPQREQIVAQVSARSCGPEASSSEAIVVQQPAVSPDAAVPPESPAPDPAEMPAYWHIRIEPVHARVPVDPGIRAFWDKGVYAFFREDGQLGFNTDDPGPYFYQGAKTWRQSGGNLVIDLDGASYTLALPSAYDETLTTVDAATEKFRMFLYPKLAGQR